MRCIKQMLSHELSCIKPHMNKRAYKYYKFNELNLSAIIKKSLWASLPSEFNDPFEFSFRRGDFPEDKLKEHLINGANLNRDSIYNMSDIECWDLFSKEIKSELHKFSVISFSKEKNIIPMWSHYADSFTGFCIGFDMQNEFLLDVNYPKDSFCPKLNHNPQTLFKDVLYNKSVEWGMEQEMRVVLNRNIQDLTTNKGKYVSYVALNASVTEVIFGFRMGDENRKTITTIFNHDNLKFFEAYPDEDEYKVRFKSI